MATVTNICKQALIEIGACAPDETPSTESFDTALLRFQNQLDGWQAERLTLSLQARLSYALPSGTSTITIGPSMATITAQRPVWINQINFVNPGSSPEQEVPLGAMNADQYNAESIKQLQSSLPQQYFYQTEIAQTYGSLFFWPQVTQSVKVYIYAPKGVDVPASLSDVVIGPPGYAEAFIYQLALRLCTPFSRPVPQLLPGLAQQAWARMQRPNVAPGLLGVDPAIVQVRSGGYNILTDNSSAPGGR